MDSQHGREHLATDGFPLDATTTLAKFNDAAQWSHVDYGVPIWVEHELWEVPHPFRKGQKIKRAVLPGDPKPEAGEMLYSIGPEELQLTAAKINANLLTYGKAIKVFIGHSDASKPQEKNPEIVGYSVGAKMGTYGPKGIKAVL